MADQSYFFCPDTGQRGKASVLVDGKLEGKTVKLGSQSQTIVWATEDQAKRAAKEVKDEAKVKADVKVDAQVDA